MKNICKYLLLSATAFTLLTVVSACSVQKMQSAKTVAGNVKSPVADNLSHNSRLRFDYFLFESENQEQKDNLAGAFDLLDHCKDIDSTSANVYYKKAELYVQLKQDSLALLNFEKAATYDPSNSYYEEILAQFYTHAAKYDKAIAAYEKLYNTNKDRPDVLEILLQLYNQKTDYDNVINTIERLENVAGANEKLLMAKVQIYSLQGKKKEAINVIRQLAESHPNDLNYRVIEGDWQMENGLPKEALATYGRVLKQEPDNTMAQMSMLSYYKNNNQDSLANTLLKKLLVNNNTGDSEKLDLMKQAVTDNEQKGGDSTQILNLFKDVFKEKQTDPNMYILCSVYMNAKKMPKDSIAVMLNKVLEIAPDNAASRLQLIQYAWEKKDYNQAIELCKPALEYNPDEMAFFYYLGMAYYFNNDLDNALEIFRKGTSLYKLVVVLVNNRKFHS